MSITTNDQALFECFSVIAFLVDKIILCSQIELSFAYRYNGSF